LDLRHLPQPGRSDLGRELLDQGQEHSRIPGWIRQLRLGQCSRPVALLEGLVEGETEIPRHQGVQTTRSALLCPCAQQLRREHGVKERTAVRYLHASRSHNLELKLGIWEEYPAPPNKSGARGSEMTGFGNALSPPAWGSKLAQPYPGCLGVQAGGLC